MKTCDIKANLHTHTSFCDGNDMPEVLVRAAIELGMETLGFSGHCYTPFDSDYTMSPEGTEQYCREILRLKEQYANQIDLLLGIEQDLCAPIAPQAFDFRIGSVHYVSANGEYLSVDHTFEISENAVTTHFGGDWYRFTRAYFETVADRMDRFPCDIVGHFDLVSKFNEKFPRFDERSPRYLHPAMEALDALLDKNIVFEINTGAIARGYRRLPYPAPVFLHRIAERRGRITLSSDSHDRENLLYGFSDACKILRACGISSVWVMGKSGWREVGI